MGLGAQAELRALLAVVLASVAAAAAAVDFSGHVEVQQRWFTHDHLPGQDHGYSSLAAQPQWRYEPDPRLALTLRLFGRKEFSDDSRTHADVREAMLQFSGERDEFRAGIGDVFWGVMESRHLVDIINQHDFLERFDGEARLGQPMLAWSRHGDRQTVDAYLLPVFREREFPARGGRLRSPLPVGSARYESGAGRRHVDAALRWQLFGEGSDIALSYFHGTAREPVYTVEPGVGGLLIRPHYLQLRQWGLEAQKATGNLLLKLEAVHRHSDTGSRALVAGGEYTWPDVMGGDLGLVFEYLYDSRDSLLQETFQDDLFAGVRFASSALASTEFLAGVYQERRGGGRVVKLEGSTRLGAQLMLTVEVWRFDHLDRDAALALFERDDFIEVGLRWHFD